MTVKDYISDKDRFAKHLGIQLSEVSTGKAKAQMQIKEEHLNSVNIIHGGAVFTLADLTFAAASNSHGTVAVAINASISFMKSAEKGDVLYAEAFEVSINHKLASYTVQIKNSADELIASFQGMVYRKKESLI